MRVLFIDTVHDHLWSHLTRMDFDCVDGSEWSRPQILNRIIEFEGVVIRSRIVLDKEFLDAAKNLRFVALDGS